MSEPVKTHLSPGLTRSTFSARSTTSTLRGMEPAGISSEFSCTRRRCQSTKRDCATTTRHLERLLHASLLQRAGSVYLNCCSMFGTSVPHSRHRKLP